MKKYFYGIFALLLAVGFSSFEKATTSTRIAYELTTFASGDVQTLANWSEGDISCPTGDVKACEFVVPDQYIDGSGNLINVTIVTSGSNPAKVTAVKAGNPLVNVHESIQNKAN